MAERVERFEPWHPEDDAFADPNRRMLPNDEGPWVRFKDYERVEKERDELLEGIEAHRSELSHGITANSRLADEQLHAIADRIKGNSKSTPSSSKSGSSESCPTCGSSVEVHRGDEGTGFYVPLQPDTGSEKP